MLCQSESTLRLPTGRNGVALRRRDCEQPRTGLRIQQGQQLTVSRKQILIMLIGRSFRLGG